MSALPAELLGPLPLVRAKYITPSVVYMAATLHLLWGVLLLLSQDTAGATPVHGLRRSLGSEVVTPVLLIGAALLAFASLLPRWSGSHSKWAVVALVPQQILLIISLVTALMAMWYGQYADGVQRPHSFVIADQLPIVVIATWHSFVLFTQWGKLALIEVAAP